MGRWGELITHYSLLVTPYSLLLTYYLLLITSYFLFLTSRLSQSPIPPQSNQSGSFQLRD